MIAMKNRNQLQHHHGVRISTTMFERKVSEKPQGLALVSRCGLLTYADLNARANQLARHLNSLGVGLGCIVAVALKRGVEYVISMLACWKVGATYLPLDQSLPCHRMEFMILDSGASCLITFSGIVVEKSLGLGNGHIICLDEEGMIAMLKPLPIADLPVMVQQEDLAYIIYTSGTTGNPKGVAIAHGNLFNLVEDISQSGEIDSSDRVLLFSPLCFDASIRDITGTLMLGASLYVPEEEEILPGNLMKTIAQQGITNSVITPSVLRTCSYEHLPQLKTIVIAGEAADEALIRTWGAGRTLINAYGPTEATVCSTKRVYHDGEIPAGSSASVIGRPVLNTTITIVDDHDNAVEYGKVGEIVITGPGVSHRGYLNLPQLNAECFMSDPAGSYRSYKTGDFGRITSQMEVECLGRKNCSRQIKLNGQRIELEEIENVVRGTAKVLDVAVVTQGDASLCRLCAYIVPIRGHSQLDEEEFVEQLHELMMKTLPSYSIPSVVRILDALPLTVNGKVDFKALASAAIKDEGLPRHLAANTILTPLEGKIALALREGLNLPEDKLMLPSTTYGELGGSSLRASLVLRHLNASIGCDIHLGQFYRKNSSIRQIAELILTDPKQQRNSLPDDLAERTKLPHDIVYNVRAPTSDHHHHILLTGSTGFLGGHLLAEILNGGRSRVSCVVRAQDKKLARARVESTIRRWGLWQEDFAARFDVFCGDIAKPLLGLDADDYLYLANDVDTVYHSAAVVSFIASYAELEEANVTGTIEILRFASNFTQKRLTYISTLSVFFRACQHIQSGGEVPVSDLDGGILTGYAQSKWVSEELVLKWARLGGHALILRPGRLLGNTQNHKCPSDDFTIRLIASILQTGCAPTLDTIGGANWQIDLTPVDLCAQLAYSLSVQEENGIRHIINDDTIAFETICSSLGRPITWIPYQEWLPMATRTSHLAPLSTLFYEPISSEDGRSVFEALFHMAPFRNSSYESTALTRSTYQLPSALGLLNDYLTANGDIFSHSARCSLVTEGKDTGTDQKESPTKAGLLT